MLTALFELIPKWVWVALVAALSATSCKLKWDNQGLTIEVEKHATKIAGLKADIQESNARAAVQAARFEQQARAAEQARSQREKALLADAAGAKSELDGLRSAIAATRAGYGLSANPTAFATGLDPTDTFAELLSESAGRYTELAATCDRHVNDIKTLTDAWPKSNN